MYDMPRPNTAGVPSTTFFKAKGYDISVCKLTLCGAMHAYSKQIKKVMVSYTVVPLDEVL